MFISLESKTTIYKTYKREQILILLYSFSERQMKILHSNTSKPLRNKTKSNDIRIICDVPDIVWWVRLEEKYGEIMSIG